MQRAQGIVAIDYRKRVATSAMAARLDVVQSLSGLALAIFMWAHMLFVSSILLGKDAMWTVTKFFEGYWFFGRAYPWLVSVAAGAVTVLFIVHAVLAVRKCPSAWKEYSTFRTHMKEMRHDDTSLWFVQVYTGFAMLFLGPVHLYIMLTNPQRIGPYESADRVWSGWMWPLYILLLLAVELASNAREAADAVDLFVYRITRELGSLAAALGGLDALAFTAGIGEHAAPVRARVCENAAWLGIQLDAAANLAGEPRISSADSPVSVWVVPTNEELMIARHTLACARP